MLTPRLEIFYEKIVCEDFIILYNFTNIAKLPKLEHAILSSTSNNFGSSKISVLQSFCGWRFVTSQRSIITRARKSIALFNIRKDTLLGLKVTLRKKTLFSLFDKALIFVLPKIVTNKSDYVLPRENQNNILSVLKENNKNLIVPYPQNLSKPIKLALPYFLKNKQAFCDTIDKNDRLQLLRKRRITFLNKLFQNWQKQRNEKFSIDFLLPNNILEKKNKNFNVKTNSKVKTFFTLSNNSALIFPEISSLSLLFDNYSGFSLTFSLKHSKFLHNFTIKHQSLIKKQFLSAFGYLKD